MPERKEKTTIDLFCSVIDNYGDIGVCYRLARELGRYNYLVTIWVDNMLTLNKIEPAIKKDTLQLQLSNHIIIKYWAKTCKKYYPSSIVIEAFACNLSESYTSKFNSDTIWINLEYLSAEDWVAECHCLPSIQNNGISKYFFFPGFTKLTGGLNFEKTYLAITQIEARKQVQQLLNLNEINSERFTVHIFIYETPQLFPLLKSILKIHPDAIFLLPQSRSTDYLQIECKDQFSQLQQNFPNSIWKVFPMVSQIDYSYIIKACHLNIVRGEDSITQAVISGTPFLWHIYKQDNDAHIEKLNAFTKLMTANAPSELQKIVHKAFLELNNYSVQINTCIESIVFDDFMVKYEEIFGLCKRWSEQLIQNNSLGRNLSEFINSCLDKE